MRFRSMSSFHQFCSQSIVATDAVSQLELFYQIFSPY